MTLYYDPDHEMSSTRAVPAVLSMVLNSHLVVPKLTEARKSLFTYAAVMTNILGRILSSLLITQNLEFK